MICWRGNDLEERLANLEGLSGTVGSTAVGRRVERATVVQRQVDVLVVDVGLVVVVTWTSA